MLTTDVVCDLFRYALTVDRKTEVLISKSDIVGPRAWCDKAVLLKNREGWIACGLRSSFPQPGDSASFSEARSDVWVRIGSRSISFREAVFAHLSERYDVRTPGDLESDRDLVFPFDLRDWPMEGCLEWAEKFLDGEFDDTRLHHFLLAELQDFQDAEHSERVEFALSYLREVFELGGISREDWLTVLWSLAGNPNHSRHEDVVHYLQWSPVPESIKAVATAIALKPSLGYLAYDDYGAFYRQCLFALEAIGTPEAENLIREYAKSKNSELAGVAKEWIDESAGRTR